MKFWQIFRYELRYQQRSAWPWLIVLMLMVLVFLFMRDGSFSTALYTEFFVNSPFMIAMATVFGCLLWLLTGAFVSGEAAARDIATGMQPLAYTAPVTKAQYLGGRFLAALTLNALLLLTVQLAIALAIYLPGVHPESIGPFRPAAFFTAYAFIALPNAFAATALQFAFALWSGRPIAAYMASLFLFFVAFFIAALILFRRGLGILLDPIGIRFIWDELSHLWTTAEKSWRMLALEGTLLHNRLVWISFGVLVSAVTFFTFRFRHRAAITFQLRIPRFRTGPRVQPSGIANKAFAVQHPLSIHDRNATFALSSGFRLAFRQMLVIARTSFAALATSWPGLALLFGIPLMAIPVVVDQMYAFGIPLSPTSAHVISELTGPLSADLSRWMVIPGFIIYFAGELAWREREHGVGEITDAMPGSDWARVLGKLLAIVLMLIAFTTTLSLAGISSQVLMDYTAFELDLYVKIMFLLQLPEYILFAVLAIFVHAAVNQKYAGHLVAIVAYAFIAAIATMLGIEHNLLIYGAAPGWSYTEMRGFGPFIGPWLWFKLYWAAWALLLVICATGFWTRGKESGFKFRLHLARQRFSKPMIVLTTAAVVIIVLLGAFIFYNTNVLNNYLNSKEVGTLRAEYEKRHGRYELTPQPELAHAKLHIEIFPQQRAVDIKGSYVLVNNTNLCIDSIHISTPVSGAIVRSITFNRKAELALDDEQHHYRIYKLQAPVKPDDSVRLDFEVAVAQRGFRNGGIDRSVVTEGGYFNNEAWFPHIGFQRKRGIINPAERRTYGLAPRPIIGSLYEAHGESPSLGRGVLLEVVMGTVADQVAVAPGALQRTWLDKATGRRYFQYATSAPIGAEWAFFSANYNIYEKQWVPAKRTHRPVVVRIFHYPKHTQHLERMMNGTHAALEYYTTQFGPYPYDHLTIVENPVAPGTGMHADASMISHGQGYAHWIPENENMLDLPYAIMGHEMGHQWTLPYAMVEGLPFLAEGLAWHYGIMLVKATRSPEQLRRLMSFMRQPYPHQPIRRGEPLLRALDPYLAYKRGPLAMFALSEYAGADRVNGALQKLVEKSNAPGAAEVTTLDLYRELKAATPDTLQRMLYEFFEVNTLWQFETNSVSVAKVRKDEWQVTLDVKATKIVYDTAGLETEVPVDEWVPIGVFAERMPGQDELSAPLYLEKHRIRSGNQTIVVTVAGRPVLAGIDPHHVLDWEEKEDDDNIEAIETGPEEDSSKSTQQEKSK